MNIVLAIIFIFSYPMISVKNSDFKKIKNNPYLYFRGEKESTLLSNKEIIDFIEKNNINYKILYNNKDEYQYVTKSIISNENFIKYNEIIDKMNDIVKKYPEAFEMISIGKSEENRDIYVLKNILNRDAPRYRIAGGIHGNEAMSYQFVYDFMNYIVNNQILCKNLLENIEIWFIPMLNPDGCVNVTRRNINDVDINRNLGFYFEYNKFSGEHAFSQKESKVIRDNTLENNFTLSFSYHTYGNYINYVWNFSPQKTGDDKEILEISNIYKKHNQSYTITNGYEWYRTTGDLNDYSYGTVGNIDWTIELKDFDKDGSVFENNKNALLEILKTNKQGVEGRVYDKSNNKINAILSIISKDNIFYTNNGYFYRYLLPGSYEVRVKAKNYREVEKEFIVEKNKRTNLNIKLEEELPYLNPYKLIKIENNYVKNNTSLFNDILFEDNRYFKLFFASKLLLEFELKEDKKYILKLKLKNNKSKVKINLYENIDSDIVDSFYYDENEDILIENIKYIELENKGTLLELDSIKLYDYKYTPRMIAASCYFSSYSSNEFIVFFILIILIFYKKKFITRK